MKRDELGEAEREIFDLSEGWSRAIVANNVDGIDSFMDHNWLMVSERGVSSKEHFLSFIANGQLTHDSMELAELHSIRILGDSAIMTARITNTAHFGGMRFDANEWTTDVFVKKNGEWKCVMTHITPAVIQEQS